MFKLYEAKNKEIIITFIVLRKDDPVDILFAYQSTERSNEPLQNKLQTTLPQGPEYDSYKMEILVKIIDDSEGVLDYYISTPVIVLPSTTNQVVYYDTFSSDSSLNKKLYENDLLICSHEIFLISTTLNSECFTDRNNLVKSG